MDGVSIAASIIGIATAGVQVSIKLVTLATQISTASDRVSAIGNDISLTSSVLRQLGDLMTENNTDGEISILNLNGLESTKTAAAMCERIFSEIEKEVKKASEQLRSHKPGLGKMRAQKIALSTTEQVKWPFLQPKIDGLRTDLRDAKSTLILLLQVANLALNKRMADASISASEYQDLIRAVVALELDRREEPANVTLQQEVSRSPSSNDAPDIGTPPTYDPGASISRTDFPGKRKRDLLKATASRVAGRSKIPRPPGIMKVPPETFPGTNLAVNTIIDSPHSSPSSGNPNSSELKLFLLKPIVRDLFDRIELRWTVQDTNMESQAIREYMNKNKKDEIPSVVEMLQQLHAYEQEVVDSQVPKDSGRWILSLKRTTTHIQARDILFQAVPGLQFVVQRHIGLSLEGSSRQTTHRVSGPQSFFSQSAAPSISSGMRIGLRNEPHEVKIAQRLDPFGIEDRNKKAAPDASSALQAEPVPDEEAEAEAEAMVNDLLKQYTTLFDS